MKNSITVIIPVFNAERYLEYLFDALEKNIFLEGDEILLIDNGSTDHSLELCRQMCEKKPGLYKSILFNEKAGSYAARNFAVKQAKGTILVFTDSDTKPKEDWISTIRRKIKPGVVLAGRVELEIEDERNLWERFDTIAHLNSEVNAHKCRVATANMAVLKQDFFKVGFFEERFSGGDYEWSMRASNIDLRIYFLRDAVVKHPTRKSFDQILKKEQRIAYGVGNHQKLQKKSYILLVIRYILKIFKIDTNLRYTQILKKMGFERKKLKEFNRKFMIIRIEQLRYAIKGYKMIDPRFIKIK